MADVVAKQNGQRLSRRDAFTELGNRGLWKENDFHRDFLSFMRGRRASATYREMVENDPTVGGITLAIDMVLRQVRWEVEPVGSGNGGEVLDEDIERADFLDTAMQDLSHTWEDFISDALTMLPYGFSFLEVVYKRRETPSIDAPGDRRTKFPDGKIGWRKFVLIPQDTIHDWELDETGGIQAAKQRTRFGFGETLIPVAKALLFRTSRSRPTGKSILRSAIKPWFAKKRIEEIEGIGIERDLAGLPVMYAEQDYLSSFRSDLQDIIRNIRRDEQEGVLLPLLLDDSGNRLVSLELLSSGGARQFDTNAIIARYKRDIATSVLQDVLLLGQERIGTQALASEKRDLSDTALQAWLNEIAAVVNDFAVPRLFSLNGESLENLPKIVPGELRPTDVAEFATALKDAAAAGFLLGGDPEVEAEVRRRLGLPAMNEEMVQVMTDELLNPPEPPPMVPVPHVPPPADDADDADDADES